MRLIGNFYDKQSVRLISLILNEEGIKNTYEEKKDPSTHELIFHLWIYDETSIEKAKGIVHAFEENPDNPSFLEKLPYIESDKTEQEQTGFSSTTRKRSLLLQAKKHIPPITKLVIVICCLLFIWSFIEYRRIQNKAEIFAELGFTKLDRGFLYDFPSPYEKLYKILYESKVKTHADFRALPEETKQQIRSLVQAPYWKGFYEIIVHPQKSAQLLDVPLFYSIRKGEIWRLISPVFLHGSVLHILLNMLWLWLLGKQVEQRIGMVRYIALSVIIAIVSNTFQYLMSGPLFLGYSGIIAGLAGFIWMRQKLAPWEGYPLGKNTINFLVIFVVALTFLQLASYLLQIFQIFTLPIYIANTAHIVGAITGIILARIPIFSLGKQ